MVAKKIFEIMQEVDYIGRDTKIESRKSGSSYKVLSSEKVLELLRPKFIEHKLVIITTAATAIKDGSVTTGEFEYRIIDVEDDDYICVASVGQGSDTQDKGAGMSATYAFKNMLLKMFMIITNDDPDMQHSDNIDLDQEELSRLYARAEYLGRVANTKGVIPDETYGEFQSNLATAKGNANRLHKAIAILEERFKSNGIDIPTK